VAVAREPEFEGHPAQAVALLDAFDGQPGPDLELIVVERESGGAVKDATEVERRGADAGGKVADRGAAERLGDQRGAGPLDEVAVSARRNRREAGPGPDRPTKHGAEKYRHLLLDLERIVEFAAANPVEQGPLVTIQGGRDPTERDREGTPGTGRGFGVEVRHERLGQLAADAEPIDPVAVGGQGPPAVGLAVVVDGDDPRIRHEWRPVGVLDPDGGAGEPDGIALDRTGRGEVVVIDRAAKGPDPDLIARVKDAVRCGIGTTGLRPEVRADCHEKRPLTS